VSVELTFAQDTPGNIEPASAAHVALEVGIAIRIPWRKHDDASRRDDEILEAASRLVVQFRYQRRTVLFEQVDTNCQRHCAVV